MNRISHKLTLALATVLIAVIVVGPGAAAQNSPASDPKQAIEKLKYFVGDWKQEGSIAASHNPAAGKYTGTYHNAMAPGGFFVELHSSASTGQGNWTSTGFLGYNANEKVYTFDEFASTGEHTVARGTLEGDTWTWTTDSKMGGQTMNGRYIEKMTSPTSYDFKFEASMDGGKTWATFLEGKSTKVEAAAEAKPAPSGTGAASDKPAAKKPAGAAKDKKSGDGGNN